MFWHCHMLRPCKYLADCQALTGGLLIDHEPTFTTKGANSLKAKLDEIFPAERKAEREGDDNRNCFDGRLDESVEEMLFGPTFDVANLAHMMYRDMQGDNDCG